MYKEILLATQGIINKPSQNVEKNSETQLKYKKNLQEEIKEDRNK